MSNLTAPPDSLNESPPTPSSEEEENSSPSLEASSPPAPPPDSNPTPTPEDSTLVPPQSPLPILNISPPPTLESSPPPSPPQSLPHSPPVTGTSPLSPPPVSSSPPPGSESPIVFPPPSSIHLPPPPSDSSHVLSSPPPLSSEHPPVASSPPPDLIPLNPPTTGTPPLLQEPLQPLPPSQILSPHPGEFTSPPLSEGSLPSTPLQTLSPPSLTPPVVDTASSPLFPSSTTQTNGTSPTSSTSTTPPSSTSLSHRSSSPSPPTDNLSNSVTSYAIVGVVAGVVIIAFIAIFFGRRKKKRITVYDTQYMPPYSFSAKSDGYYLHSSGPVDAFCTQPQLSLHGMGNGCGSQRGNMYYQETPDSNTIGGTKSGFSYEEVMEMTNGFSRANIIGEGGFGCVFKGLLPDGRVVAVKQLKKGSGQGEREFQAEVEIISRVHHRYLVSLVGYCIHESQRLLIYEYVPNNTLEHHLHGKGVPVLEWDKRMKIALGAARGLAYLHEDCHPKIIHRDIKSANILLDDAFEAQVADFGLAKLTDDTNTHVSTRVMGTFGYMAPEYASSGKLTDRSDVFSFGVMLLELVTGRKPVDPSQPLGDESLVEWARPLLNRALETGDFSELVDARLQKHYVESEMFRMIEAATACVRHSAQKRPRMMQVARALDCESETSDLSNGVKYGQSTVYESGQYNQDITRFRRMAFGSGNSKEFDMYSGEYTSREVTPGLTNSWKSGEISSESETQAMNGDAERRFRH